jgi:hypothetical protein
MVQQYLSDEIGIEYGIKKTWRVALVAPDGEISVHERASWKPKQLHGAGKSWFCVDRRRCCP